MSNEEIVKHVHFGETKREEIRIPIGDTTPDTPSPADVSVDESKIHEFNRCCVCLDDEGPILTLKEVQMKTSAYLSEYDGWKEKFPPKLLFLLFAFIGVASYGIVLMAKSNFDNQVSLIVCPLSFFCPSNPT